MNGGTVVYMGGARPDRTRKPAPAGRRGCVLQCEYGITAVPTIHFYKDGKLVGSHVGVMQPQAVKDVIAQYMYA